VDIDPQAVEVTKLSLLMKVLEGENEQTIQPFLRLFHQRALPDLGDNIKCGNSLIGPEAYQEAQLSLLPESDQYRINVFDWSRGFPEVMKAGGFDAVIGNPPYIRIQTMKEWAPTEVELYKKLYKSAASGNYDIYVVFVEKALSLLNKAGKMGFILPHKFFNAQYGEGLRGIISKGKHLSHVIHFGDQQVFNGATTYTCLLFLDKAGTSECHFVKVDKLDIWRIESRGSEGRISTKQVTGKEWNFIAGESSNVYERVNKISPKLGEIADIFVGLQTSADKIYVVPLNTAIEKGLTKSFLLTGNLSPYQTPVSSARLVFPYELINMKARLMPGETIKKRYPKGWEYLCAHHKELAQRSGGDGEADHWYAYVYPKNLVRFAEPKLIIQVTSKRPTVMYDETGLYISGGGSGPFYGIRPKEPKMPFNYLLGILNSALFGWLVKTQSTNLRGGYIKFSKQYIETVPIVPPDNAGPAKAKNLACLVDDALRLKRRLAHVMAPHDKEMLERQYKVIVDQIDNLVFEIYRIDNSEIKLIKESISE
jgi:hypothetical protein